MENKKLQLLKKTILELQTVKRIVNDNPKKQFITSVPYLYYLNNGRVIPRERLLKNGLDGSAVIIAAKVNDEFLVTIEPRVFTEQGVAVSFPAGYIEKGETPEEAARRELLE